MLWPLGHFVMRLRAASAVLLTLMHLEGMFATPLATELSSSLLQLSLNSSGLDFSPAFKVEIISNVNVPIDSEEIYRTAIDMMFKVSDFPLTQSWPNKVFPSPIGLSRILLKHSATGKEHSILNTHTVIWGLNHLMLSMTLSKKFCQTKAVLKFEGDEIGSIEVVPRSTPSMSQGPVNSAELLQLGNETLPSLGHYFDRFVTIKTEWGKKAIDRHLLYLAGIKAMSDAAEMGLDQICGGMVTTSIRQMKWSLVREPGMGIPVFKAGYSRVAAFAALLKVIQDQRFDELFVIMSVEGDVTAVGGFIGPLRAAIS